MPSGITAILIFDDNRRIRVSLRSYPNNIKNKTVFTSFLSPTGNRWMLDGITLSKYDSERISVALTETEIVSVIYDDRV